MVRILEIGLMMAATASAAVAQDHQPDHAAGSQDTPPIYDDLGDHHYGITTASQQAQAYFDQGLRLYYAFNHAEAVLSFEAAQRLDEECAMCWWGEALAWGPNINLPMDRNAALAAYSAVQEAVARRSYASEKEQALVDALATRYVADPPEDRAHLDGAYAEAMGRLAERYPDDPEVRVLHAESLMDLRPWDYWTRGGAPQPGIQDALDGLVHIQSMDPDHPGACHFYIHAVEKLFPQRAVPCAERLAGLMPGAGHLVHMPGHIYIRVGRYREAVEANQHAIHADETYIQDQRPGVGMYTAGYYPHNYDFLAFATMMIGRGDESIDAANEVSSLLPEELFGSPGMDFLQHWSMRPQLFRVRFERWREIMEVPEPAADRPHARAIWHYARGRAEAATGREASAGAELDELRTILGQGDGGRLTGLRMEFNRSIDLVALAERVLTGRLAAAQGNAEAAVAALREAVALEDALLYGEPPEWSVPARQDLGEVLLEAGRPGEADAVFLEDLQRFPSNVWSLRGRVHALRALGRTQESDQVLAELQRVWEGEGPPLTPMEAGASRVP